MRSSPTWKRVGMRLSDVLSKAPDPTPAQVEGFLADRPLKWGKHRKIKIGKVFHNFNCRHCGDQRTFESGDELYCLGLGDHAVSIDATLRCTACQSSVEAWFLVGSDGDIFGYTPEVRVERYTEHLGSCRPHRNNHRAIHRCTGARSVSVRSAAWRWLDDLPSENI